MASSTQQCLGELSVTLNELRELVKSAEDADSILHRLANDIDEACKKNNPGKIRGSKASLGGLPYLAAGFAFPPAAIGLLIVGGGLCGWGGITSGYHTLNELSITRSKCREAQRAVDTVCERFKAFKESVERLGELAQLSDFSPVLKAYSRVAVGFLVESGVAVLAIGSGILRMGFIGTLAMAPFDAYTLKQCNDRKNSKNWSEQANEIRDLAGKMHDIVQEGNALLKQKIHDDQA